MPTGPRLAPALILLGALLLAGAATAQLADPAEDADPDEERELVAPLLKAVGPAQAEPLRERYAAGQAWASDPADAGGEASRVGLADAVQSLYATIGLDREVQAADVGAVPGAWLGPLTTLVQAHARSTPVASAAAGADLAPRPADAAARTANRGVGDLEQAAWALGALDATLPRLEPVRDVAPREPVFVDPLGLIVLGGNGDNTYRPQTVLGTTWQGPILLVEPGGNDTYHVPVAAPTQLQSPTPITRFEGPRRAIELGGNDAYRDQVAASDLGTTTQAILIDRGGNDTYADTNTPDTTANGSPGLAYLLDERGDDAYKARREGIAYAQDGGRAFLWDRAGDDVYRVGAGIDTQGAWPGIAAAQHLGAAALLWDEEGHDAYQVVLFGFGHSEGDSLARFVDEQGDDEYRINLPGQSFGWHFRGRPSATEAPLNRGLGLFLDGNGQDAYDWQGTVGDPPLPANEKTRVTHSRNHKYSAFVDCTTPPDAEKPCENQQQRVAREMATHPGVRDCDEPIPSPMGCPLSVLPAPGDPVPG